MISRDRGCVTGEHSPPITREGCLRKLEPFHPRNLFPNPLCTAPSFFPWATWGRQNLSHSQPPLAALPATGECLGWVVPLLLVTLAWGGPSFGRRSLLWKMKKVDAGAIWIHQRYNLVSHLWPALISSVSCAPFPGTCFTLGPRRDECPLRQLSTFLQRPMGGSSSPEGGLGQQVCPVGQDLPMMPHRCLCWEPPSVRDTPAPGSRLGSWVEEEKISHQELPKTKPNGSPAQPRDLAPSGHREP